MATHSMEEMMAYFDATNDHSLFSRLTPEHVKQLRRKNQSKFNVSKQTPDNISVVKVLNVLISHGIYDRKALHYHR